MLEVLYFSWLYFLSRDSFCLSALSSIEGRNSFLSDNALHMQKDSDIFPNYQVLKTIQLLKMNFWKYLLLDFLRITFSYEAERLCSEHSFGGDKVDVHFIFLILSKLEWHISALITFWTPLLRWSWYKKTFSIPKHFLFCTFYFIVHKNDGI